MTRFEAKKSWNKTHAELKCHNKKHQFKYSLSTVFKTFSVQTFQVQFQASELIFLLKNTPQQVLSYKTYEYYRTYYLLSQKIAWRLLHNTSSILKVPIALSAVNSITGNYLGLSEAAAGSDSDYLLWKYSQIIISK